MGLTTLKQEKGESDVEAFENMLSFEMWDIVSKAPGPLAVKGPSASLVIWKSSDEKILIVRNGMQTI